MLIPNGPRIRDINTFLETLSIGAAGPIKTLPKHTLDMSFG